MYVIVCAGARSVATRRFPPRLCCNHDNDDYQATVGVVQLAAETRYTAVTAAVALAIVVGWVYILSWTCRFVALLSMAYLCCIGVVLACNVDDMMYVSLVQMQSRPCVLMQHMTSPVRALTIL